MMKTKNTMIVLMLGMTMMLTAQSSWKTIGTGIPTTGSYFYANTNTLMVASSISGGSIYSVHNGTIATFTPPANGVNSLCSMTGSLFSGTSGQIHYSTNNGSTWTWAANNSLRPHAYFAVNSTSYMFCAGSNAQRFTTALAISNTSTITGATNQARVFGSLLYLAGNYATGTNIVYTLNSSGLLTAYPATGTYTQGAISVAEFNSVIYVGGNFGLAKWVTNAWTSTGFTGAALPTTQVKDFAIFNGNLYFCTATTVYECTSSNSITIIGTTAGTFNDIETFGCGLYVTGNFSSISSTSFTNIAYWSPDINVSVASSSIACNGGSTSAVVTALNGLSPFTYSWTPSGGTSASALLNAGSYSVSVSSCNGSTTIPVVLNQPAAITTTLTANTVCQNVPVSISANGGVGSFTYTWSNGTIGSTNTGTLLGVNTVTVSDANNCKSTATVNVNANPTVSALSQAICAGNSATLSASGASTYLWSNGNIVSPATTSTYNVVGTAANGCTNSAVATVTVNQLPNVTITGASTVCVNTNVNLTGNGANTYSWTNNSINASTTYSNSQAGTYTIGVTGTDANLCSNSAVATITVDACSTSTTGIAENHLSNVIKVYPNPSNGEFFVEAENGTVQVFTLTGQLILTTELNGKTPIHVEGAGMYVIKLTVDGRVYSSRLINQ